MPQTLLIADDDIELCELLREYLGQEGYDVRLAHDGEQALIESRRPGLDAMVLDIMMPRMNGIDVLRKLRRESELPVIMLTARGDDLDRIIGLELGADDYLAKPANPRELLARIRAILRRSNAHSTVATLEVGDLVLNQGGRELRRDGQLIDLTSTEFSIIQLLLQHNGEVVEKKDLYLAALGRARPFAKRLKLCLTDPHLIFLLPAARRLNSICPASGTSLTNKTATSPGA